MSYPSRVGATLAVALELNPYEHRSRSVRSIFCLASREGEGIAAGLLISLGVELDRVRAETLKVLGEKNEEQDQ